MVLSEERYWKYKSIAPATNYYEDFNNVMTNIIKAELDYKQAMKTIDGTPEGAGIPNDTALNKLTPEEKTAREANIQKALDNLTKAR
jgi:formiminotetrahydrofolate cyclodeaminase